MPSLVTTLVALLAAVQVSSHAEPCIGGRDQDRTRAVRVQASLSACPPSGSSYTYGETASDPSSQYNGRVYDPGTGFHDYGARMYWPEIGRFISADSYQGDPANPASLNRYAYVLNNPYKYLDPSGHAPSFVGCLLQGGRQLGWGNIGDFYWGGAVGTAEGILAPAGPMKSGSAGYAYGRAAGMALGGGIDFALGAIADVGGLATGPGELVIAPVGTAVAMKGVASIFLASQVKPGDGGGAAPTRVSNPKHHPGSSSPEPANVQELWEQSIEDSSGVRWARDKDGTIHRFSKPSNGESHWNGSTAGDKPIRMSDIPADVRRALKN